MDPDSSNLACVVRAWQQMHARRIIQLCHPLQCPIIYFDKHHIGTWQRCLLEIFLAGLDVGSGPRDEYRIKRSPYTLQAEEKAQLLRGATTSSQFSGAIMTCVTMWAPSERLIALPRRQEEKPSQIRGIPIPVTKLGYFSLWCCLSFTGLV
jgi:hypothetical protein